jgi:hypothetical protein
MLQGGHFDAYLARFEESKKAAIEWFTQYLV